MFTKTEGADAYGETNNDSKHNKFASVLSPTSKLYYLQAVVADVTVDGMVPCKEARRRSAAILLKSSLGETPGARHEQLPCDVMHIDSLRQSIGWS